jgi:hypothetical protein
VWFLTLKKAYKNQNDEENISVREQRRLKELHG